MKFKLLYICCAAITVTAAVSGQNTPDRPITSPTSTISKLTTPHILSWRWTGPTATANNTSMPAIDKGVIFFGSGNRFMALDLETGTKKWQYPSDEGIPGTFKTAPAIADGVVYVGSSEGNMYAFHEDTGKPLWTFSTRIPINSSPIVADGRVYFGANDGVFYAVDAKTGDSIYGKNSFRTGDVINSAPIFNEGMVIFASNDGSVYGLLASTGKPKWRFPSDSRSNNAPVMAAGNIYVAGGSTLYALNNQNGRPRWSKTFATNIAVSPTANESGVYVITDDNRLYGFDTAGKSIYKKAVVLPNAPATRATLFGGEIVLPLRRGMIEIRDASTGDLKWQYMVRNLPNVQMLSNNGKPIQDYVNVTAPAIVTGDSLILITEDGSLFSFSKSTGVDSTPPEVEYTFPEPGDQIPGQPPLDIQAKIEDEGSGIDPASVKLLLDDQPLDAAYDPVRGTLIYKFISGQTIKPLSDGKHDFRILASDWNGNNLNYQISVNVDNSLKHLVKKRYNGTRPAAGPGRGGGSSPFGPGGGSSITGGGRRGG